jgi:hypothetical protein
VAWLSFKPPGLPALLGKKKSEPAGSLLIIPESSPAN